ncbi:MAG TPA: polymorphic toxin-type HINT domain-containing protein [Puia sp.]|jgi:RHS repeat-associated protein
MKRNIHSHIVAFFSLLTLCASLHVSAQQYPYDIVTISGKYAFSYNQVPDQLLPLQPVMTGVTFEWKYSTRPTGTFSDLPGSYQNTSYSFSTPLAQTTYVERLTWNAAHTAVVYTSNVLRLELVSAGWENYNYVREHDVLVPGQTDWKGVDQLPIGQKLQTTTYSDGIGRILQRISKQIATPDPAQGGTLWGDVVKFARYDEYGRAWRKDLLYTTADQAEIGKYKSAPLIVQPQYYSSVYNESAPYSETQYEQNPLNRVTNVKLPGSVGNSSQGETFTYDLNTTDDNVQNFSIGDNPGDAPVSQGAYQPYTLFRNVSKDEKNQQVIEYTDNAGELILRKVQVDPNPSSAHNGWSCTYFVYDDFGLLRYKIQPEAVKWLDGNSWSFANADGPTVLDQLCFRYEFDDKGRTTLKKTPGAKELYMVYDARDRVIFSQDGNQRKKFPGEWLVSFYDDLDRLTETALYETTKTGASLQTDIDNATTTTNVGQSGPDPAYQPDPEYSSRDVNIPVYTASNSITFLPNFTSADNDNFLAQIAPPVTVGPTVPVTTYGSPVSATVMADPSQFLPLKYNFYDDYGYAGVKTFDNGFNNVQAYPASDPTVLPIATDNRTLGMLTGTKVRILGTSTFLFSSYYYDEKGQAIQTIEDNIKSGVDITTTQYHFDERVLSVDERHTASGTAFTNFDVLTKNIYDQVGRMISIQKKYGTNAMKTVASYDLDDMGRLKNKHLDPGYTGSNGTGSDLESLAYSYDIQGMINGINKDYALKTPGKYDKWGHFFGQYYGYDNKDGLFSDWQLDGHITGTIWSTQGDDVQRKYNYSYDATGRLINALYGEKQNTGDSWSVTKMDFTVTGRNGKIEYDLNGNLLYMLQKGVVPGNQTPVSVDDLQYRYAHLSNKLSSVVDGGNAGTANGKLGDFSDGTTGTADNDYVYDDNGNVVIDLNKAAKDLGGVTGANGISYNYLDKPEQIHITGKGTVQIVYDADGARLQKIYTPEGSSTPTTTTYINDYVYVGDNLQFINFEEGRIRVMHSLSQNNGYDMLSLDGNMDLPGGLRGAYDFFVRDMQHNTRVILTEETHVGSNSCTMEMERAGNEEPLFGKVDANGAPSSDNEVKQRFLVTSIPGQSSGGGWQNPAIGHYVSQLGNLVGKKIGPNALLKVMAGDRISAQSIYYYQDPVVNSSGGTSLVTDLISSLGSAIGGSGITSGLMHASAAGIVSPLTGSVPFSAIVDPDAANAAGNNPKAYMTVLFFDERFNFIGEGSTSARVTQSGNGATPLVLPNIRAPKNGYVYVYVSNESDESVYFDNLQVSNNHGAIIEENHYYAYGLKIAGISSRLQADPNEGATVNKYLFNDTELDDEADLNWYDFGFRNYDPQIGRFVQQDPLADDYAQLTPYQYANDEPIMGIDEDGAESIPSGVAPIVRPTAEQLAAKAARAASVSAKSVATSFLKGFGQSLWGAVKGVGAIIENPAAAAAGIAHVVNHPSETFNALKTVVKQTYNDFKNGDANTRANILGKLTGEVVQLLGPGEISEVSKLAELGEIGKGAEELADLGKLGRAAHEGEEAATVASRVERTAVKEVRAPCGCFLPGTLILTVDGYKPIEKIKAGDIVWAYNDTTHAYGKKKVIRTFEHVRDTVYQVHIGQETINTTSDHPFFVAGRWLRVKELRAGDSVMTYSGARLVITAIQLVVKRITVHNFEVADYHSYYVSASRVLVHNSGPCNVQVPRKQAGKFTEPTLPDKTIVSEEGVTVEHYYKSTDHGPAHAHVKGKGPSTKIGQNGKPLSGEANLSAAQQKIISNNKAAIRGALRKIGRHMVYQSLK